MPQANKTTLKRINKEIADLQKEDIGDILLQPNESDIHQWVGWLPGPDNGPYKDGHFELKVVLPQDYPFTPPRIQFVTPIYHCNVNEGGSICLDILKNNWSPALSLYKVLLSLSALLCDPNPSDPLVTNIAQLYKSDKAKHDQMAVEHTRKNAASKANLEKRERFKQSLVSSGAKNAIGGKPDKQSKATTSGPSTAVPHNLPSTTAQGRPVAGNQRIASSGSVASAGANRTTTTTTTASTRNNVNANGNGMPGVTPTGRAGTRRTAAEIVDITDEADGNEAGRRVRGRTSQGGTSGEDAIVVD